MKGVIFIVSFFMLIIVLSSFPCQVNVLRAQETQDSELQDVNLSDYYSLLDGNIWVYDKKTKEGEGEEVFEIDGQETVGGVAALKLFIGDANYQLLNKNEYGIVMLKKYDLSNGEYLDFDPYVMVFPFSENNGKVYEFACREYGKDNNLHNDASGKGRVIVQNMGREDVEVPAGSFPQCVKLLVYLEGSLNNGDNGKMNETTWFAKNVGMVKKIIEGSDYDSNTKETSSYTTELQLKQATVNGSAYGADNSTPE